MPTPLNSKECCLLRSLASVFPVIILTPPIFPLLIIYIYSLWHIYLFKSVIEYQTVCQELRISYLREYNSISY